MLPPADTIQSSPRPVVAVDVGSFGKLSVSSGQKGMVCDAETNANGSSGLTWSGDSTCVLRQAAAGPHRPLRQSIGRQGNQTDRGGQYPNHHDPRAIKSSPQTIDARETRKRVPAYHSLPGALSESARGPESLSGAVRGDIVIGEVCRRRGPDPSWKNILENQGPLCASYEAGDSRRFRSQGDSPAYMHQIFVGLRSLEHPGYGGWGGRFKPYRWGNNIWNGAADDGILHTIFSRPAAAVGAFV